MSLDTFQGWAVRESERKDLAKAFITDMTATKPEEFSRLYLFSFPIFHKVSRMDRERQLFNAAMHEHIKQENRGNPWLWKSIGAFFIFTILAGLFLFPPWALRESSLFRNGRAWRTTIGNFVSFAAGKFQSQDHIPKKVWVNGVDPFLSLARFWRLAGPGPIDEQARTDEVISQLHVINHRLVLNDADIDPAYGDVVAVVVRGLVMANGSSVGQRDVVRAGTQITTGARSFARFIYADGSQLNVGADSSARIELTKSGDLSVVNLLWGSIRALVTKSTEKDSSGMPKEKLLILTKMAAMGIRGTDFSVTFDSTNQATRLVTFEGLVAMTKVANADAELAATALRAPGMVLGVGTGMLGEARSMEPAIAASQLAEPQLASLKATTELQGPKEAEAFQRNQVFAADLLKVAERPGVNSRSVLYEQLPQSLIDQANQAMILRMPASVSPKREDYEITPVPSRLSKDKAEFPDL